MPIDRKFLKAQTAAIDSLRSGFWNPKAPGKYIIRLTDGWAGSKTYYVDVATHYQVGPTKARVICPKLTSSLAKKSRECPVCDRIQKLLTGNDQQKALAQQMRPSIKYLMNIYVRPSSIETGGMKIGQFGKTIHDRILGFVMNPDEDDMGEILDIENGRDIKIEREGTNFTNTKYVVEASRKTSPFLEDVKLIEKLLADRPNLDKFAVGEPIAAIIAKLDGNNEETEAAEAGDEPADDSSVEDTPIEAKSDDAEPVEDDAETADDDSVEEPEPTPTRKPAPAAGKPAPKKSGVAADFQAIRDNLKRRNA